MDLRKPIDITAVIGSCKKHKDLMTTLDKENAADILKHFTPISGVKDSITLGRTTLASVSRKYTGKFLGQVAAGKIVPRVLKVYPCVMEMEDEPERYRRSYLQEVDGGLDPNKHPFGPWLINYGIKSASADLANVVLTAKYDDGPENNGIKDAFDGLMTIIEAEKTATNISVEKGNQYATGDLTRADIGTKLLEMWRQMPQSFRNQGGKMYMSEDLAEMYDDWLDDQGTLVTGSGAETAGQQFLRNTNKKCEIVRLPGMPEGSKFVMITQQWNLVYGFDKRSDFAAMVPFASGNPYTFTAAGKYVLGFQVVTIDKSVFLINDQAVNPSVILAASEPETTAGDVQA